MIIFLNKHFSLVTYWINYVKDLWISGTIDWTRHFIYFYLSAKLTLPTIGRCCNRSLMYLFAHRQGGWCGTGWCRRWRWAPLWFYTTDRRWCPRPACCGTWQTSLGELVKHTWIKAAKNSRDLHWEKMHYFSFLYCSWLINVFSHCFVKSLNGWERTKLLTVNVMGLS